MRTRDGMAIVCAIGKLRGKQPSLSDRPQRELCHMHAAGEYSISDLAEIFTVSRPTVYRTLNRRHSPYRTILPSTGVDPKVATNTITTQRRTYRLDGADFTLQPVNDSVTKVTHRDQVGWIGISTDWNAQRPYGWTTIPRWVGDDGIHNPVLTFDTPDSGIQRALTLATLATTRLRPPLPRPRIPHTDPPAP